MCDVTSSLAAASLPEVRHGAGALGRSRCAVVAAAAVAPFPIGPCAGSARGQAQVGQAWRLTAGLEGCWGPRESLGVSQRGSAGAPALPCAQGRMYTLLSGLYKYMFRKDEYCILILGLDNAGKTVGWAPTPAPRHFSPLWVPPLPVAASCILFLHLQVPSPEPTMPTGVGDTHSSPSLPPPPLALGSLPPWR